MGGSTLPKRASGTVSLHGQCMVHRATVSAVAALCMGLAVAAQAQPADKVDGGATSASLPTVTITAGPSAVEDLPQPYVGGQVATGARLGMLGNVDILDAPFNITAYTAQVIEDQQARTLADVLGNDPSVRFTTSSGHAYENFRVRGFDVN